MQEIVDMEVESEHSDLRAGCITALGGGASIRPLNVITAMIKIRRLKGRLRD